MAGKFKGDIFGTFLGSISESPSTSGPEIDLSRLTQSVIDWTERQPSTATPSDAPPAVIPRLVRAIAEANTSLSVGALIKSTNLDADTIAAALRNATATGLLRDDPQADGTHLFGLTPDGLGLLVNT